MRVLLWSLGAVGIVMPWGRAYVLAAWIRDPDTRRHELVHLRQVQRDMGIRCTAGYQCR